MMFSSKKLNLLFIAWLFIGLNFFFATLEPQNSHERTVLFNDIALKHLGWELDGNAICSANNDQLLTWGNLICSDGADGIIMTWRDLRDNDLDIFVQRINASGQVLWVENGIVIGNRTAEEYYPQICSDGLGGAFITWSVEYDLYIQRVNASGHIQGLPNGTAINNAGGEQFYAELCSDGENGVIVTWMDYRKGISYDIYAQRFNSSLDKLWSSDDIVICNATNNQWYPHICSDGLGGAIIVWEDHRTGSTDIYAQRINATGHVQWKLNGTEVCTTPGTQEKAQICSDGLEGVLITWEHGTSVEDIYAQRINSSGHSQWASNGLLICNESENQQHPTICSDGLGGAIITWQDYRDFSVSANDIYTQRVNATGYAQWGFNGRAVCVSTYNQQYPQICSDGSDGAHIIWYDQRGNAVGTGYDVYMQHINSYGDPEGTLNGMAICTAINDQNPRQILSDGRGGAFIAWEDQRDGDCDIYAYRAMIPNSTTLEAITPSIDADGMINLNWNESIGGSEYEIYRATHNITTLDGLTPINQTSDLNYTDIITANGVYFYVIVVKNAIGSSSISNCENVTVAIPLKAPDLDPIAPAVDSDGNITLNWDDVATSTLYYVYRNASHITALNGLTPIGTPTNSNYSDIITVNGIYFYVIVATDGSMNSSISNCENVTIAIPPYAPDLDPIIPSINSDGNITLNWTDINEETIYYVYRNTSFITSIDGLTPITTVNTSNCTDSISTNGIYYYVIVAFDGWANSSISDCENVTVAIPPETPDLDPIEPAVDSDGIIYLNWNDIINSTIYYIYRATSIINSVVGLVPIASVNQSSYIDHIETNNQYFYVIVASNGWVNSTPSNCETVTVSIASGASISTILLLLLFPIIGVGLAAFILYRRRDIIP